MLTGLDVVDDGFKNRDYALLVRQLSDLWPSKIEASA